MTDPLSGLAIRRESTAEQIAATLADLILDGRMPGGFRLREVNLADALGVSRASLREAVQLLVADGLVTRQPHRGAAVRRMTAADVHDIYRVRQVIELAAIEQMADGDLAPLEAAIEALKRAVAAHDRLATANAELSFHRAIVALMASPRMLDMFDHLSGETRLCLAVIDDNYADPQRLIDEHEEILAALVTGDRAGARRLLAEDLAKGDDAFAAAMAAAARAASPAT
jgi:DNA-binding GntR family transcriptional regulator